MESSLQEYQTKTNNLDFGPVLHAKTKHKDKYFVEYWQRENSCVVIDIAQVGSFDIQALKTTIAFDAHYGTGFTDKSFPTRYPMDD